MDRMCRLGMSLFDQQQKAMQLESILCCSLWPFCQLAWNHYTETAYECFDANRTSLIVRITVSDNSSWKFIMGNQHYWTIKCFTRFIEHYWTSLLKGLTKSKKYHEITWLPPTKQTKHTHITFDFGSTEICPVFSCLFHGVAWCRNLTCSSGDTSDCSQAMGPVAKFRGGENRIWDLPTFGLKSDLLRNVFHILHR